MDVYVGLDLSLRGAGFAAIDGDGRKIKDDRFGHGLKKDAPNREKIERMTHIASRIVASIREIKASGYEIAGIGIENYAFGARGAQNDLGEIHGVIKSQIWLVFGVAPDTIAASKARKTVIGKGRFSKGRAGKAEIVEAVKALGFETSDDNIADAYVIAEYLRRS